MTQSQKVGLSVVKDRFSLSSQEVAELCKKHHILKLALFGSVLRDDFGPESDIDVLVEFDPDHIPGFIRLAGMEIELSDMLGSGRKVDMNTPLCLSRYFRDELLKEAQALYNIADFTSTRASS
jgi:predicted nucleotidyltransferase